MSSLWRTFGSCCERASGDWCAAKYDPRDEQAAESSSRGFYTYWGSGFNLDFGRDENERVGHLFADGSWRNRSVVYWFDLANRHQV